jgi:two-component system cell cycle response regulator
VAQPSVEAPTPIPTRRGVILVVDNTVLNIELARRIFEPFGYEVIAASSIEEAMAALRVRAPDIIVSDLHLSRESGHDLVRLVKADENFRNIPYVFLSSTSTHESEHSRGLALGADKFLVRPIAPQKLLAEIEECLKRHRES